MESCKVTSPGDFVTYQELGIDVEPRFFIFLKEGVQSRYRTLCSSKTAGSLLVKESAPHDMEGANPRGKQPPYIP